MWLRQELMAMDTRQRRAFVKFVTASVCMPVEANPIVVHPQVRLCHVSYGISILCDAPI